jgi:hypothetical protein
MIASLIMPTTFALGEMPTPATSEDAQVVWTAEVGLKRQLRETPSRVFNDNKMMEELSGIAHECAIPGWDGYSAKAAHPDTIALALNFIQSLPLDVTMPSASAEPDGHISLEWHRSVRWTFSISISPDGYLHYSALLGASTVHGCEPFFGDVPASILNLIYRINL